VFEIKKRENQNRSSLPLLFILLLAVLLSVVLLVSSLPRKHPLWDLLCSSSLVIISNGKAAQTGGKDVLCAKRNETKRKE